MNNVVDAKQKPSMQSAKMPYEAPKATFVPLQVEERLLTCTKGIDGCTVVVNS